MSEFRSSQGCGRTGLHLARRGGESGWIANRTTPLSPDPTSLVEVVNQVVREVSRPSLLHRPGQAGWGRTGLIHPVLALQPDSPPRRARWDRNTSGRQERHSLLLGTLAVGQQVLVFSSFLVPRVRPGESRPAERFSQLRKIHARRDCRMVQPIRGLGPISRGEARGTCGGKRNHPAGKPGAFATGRAWS